MKCEWCQQIVADGSARHSYCRKSGDFSKATRIEESRYRVYGEKAFLFRRIQDPETGSVSVWANEWTGYDYSRNRHAFQKETETT